MSERPREKEGRGSSTVKGARGSGVSDARRWIAIEIERAQATVRSEGMKQQKAEGGMVEVQRQYRSTGKGKSVREEKGSPE